MIYTACPKCKTMFRSAYAWAIHARGSVAGIHLAVVVLAVLIDLGAFGGSARRKRKPA